VIDIHQDFDRKTLLTDSERAQHFDLGAHRSGGVKEPQRHNPMPRAPVALMSR